MASPYPGNVNIGGCMRYLIENHGEELFKLIIDTNDIAKLDMYKELFAQFGLQRYEMEYVMQMVLAVDPLIGSRYEKTKFFD